MKIGIMQPYFCPYLGYISLIHKVDLWVVFDISQYTPKTWINRNRILKPHSSHDWQDITIPINNSSISIKIYEANILDISKAHSRVMSQLKHYHKKAPFYNNVVSILESSFDNSSSESLVDLNLEILNNICRYLDIDFKYITCSRSESLKDLQCNKGEWALQISKIMGATNYINPIGGRDIFNPKVFKDNGIELSFLDFKTYQYGCAYPYNYIENLSIIDVMMWNSKEDILSHIQQQKIVNASKV